MQRLLKVFSLSLFIFSYSYCGKGAAGVDLEKVKQVVEEQRAAEMVNVADSYNEARKKMRERIAACTDEEKKKALHVQAMNMHMQYASLRLKAQAPYIAAENWLKVQLARSINKIDETIEQN